MKKPILTLMAAASLAPLLTSCLSDDDTPSYTDWRERNEKYVTEAQSKLDDSGNPVYTRIANEWAPSAWVLMDWHNDRSLTSGNLQPRDNSTVNVKYAVKDIDGNLLDSSYSMSTAAGDSIYQCKPSQNIVGFWRALTAMHVGDSVTVVIPWVAAYGVMGSGSIKPYSTLLFDIKLVDIPAFEIPK